MPGLFDSLHLGQQSLQVQRQGIETAGHNLANVNNPAYARQRIHIQTLPAIDTPIGSIGTGAQITAVRQLRDNLVDGQLQQEFSVRGFLEAQQSALQLGQAILGHEIDRQGAPELAGAAGTSHTLGENLGELFSAFQGLSSTPASISERQVVLMRAQTLAGQFNQTDQRLAQLGVSLNDAVRAQTDQANELLDGIARLNGEIFAVEAGRPGAANDLRDLRLAKVEELSRLVSLQVTEQPGGVVDLSISGVSMIDGPNMLDTLEAYDSGNGNLLIRSATGQAAMALTGGSIQGTIEARDSGLTTLRDNLNALASALITEVNAIHASGYSLTGSTGAAFFTGTNASDISVNAALLDDPALLQAAGVAGAVGNNETALRLAQLANDRLAVLGNQTLAGKYGQTVTTLGEALASLNGSLEDQEIVERMLLRQRDSVSGVSLDEEMTDLVKFQKAFEASARLITTVDEMLETLINM
jgi:flagellar hook-associated protein 1 FlgK